MTQILRLNSTSKLRQGILRLVLGGSLICAAAPIGSVLAAPEEMATQSFGNFQNVELTTVIEAVAKLSGHNFVIDPRVKGKVTLIAPQGMHPDALYQTLLSVLSVHGYVAVDADGVTKIVPANMAKDQLPYRNNRETSEDWVTEVLDVSNVEATKLVAILRPLVAREGHLVGLAESNRLIITDTVANIRRIKSILRKVDVNNYGQFEVIQIEHAPADDLAKTVKGLIPKNQGGTDVTIAADERSNRIILTGDEQKRMMMRALLAELDVPTSSEGRVQVIYLRYAKATDIVQVLQKIASNQSLAQSGLGADEGAQSAPDTAVSQPDSNDKAPAAVGGTTVLMNDSKQLKERISIEADERMNALIISAPTQIVSALKEVIRQLDIRRAQVLIEAIFVEVSEDRAANLGVEWGVFGEQGAGLINFSGTLPTLIGNVGNPLAQAAALGSGVNFAAGQYNGNNGWAAFLKALNSDSASNILATPSLLTLDNEEAEILVGREVPFQTGSYTSTATSVTNPFSTIERKNVGLSLKVKPQINEGDEIYLEIDQEVSDVIPKGEAVDIQTTKRQIKTRVIVGDGNVVVLGGLIDEKETQVDSKVPGLGDIPGLGALFRSTDSSRQKTNLMVFLRPVIVRDNLKSDFYSRQKYNMIFDEQQRILQLPQRSWIKPGLRPQLPQYQEWRNDNATVAPVDTPAASAPIAPKAAPTQAPIESESSGFGDSYDAFYDF
ncbi:type II secretion system protein GspD [Thiosulfatimonas sediminis]|uniref:Type II secretion system protein GspD n=1 Tax=Thiosulfatimonas sediminis TaxID=2675054 RepID=A0A6F8PSN9_9GAMM|nr:type II secretion system secretin GspD [Thiosulfatimonas sediminis]BBP45047.1 type II secretion system protein GspD [Thiosulfatimonas sediminis]